MLNLCMRSWRGVGCHFTSLFAAFLTDLCSGCDSGSVASRAAARCRCFSTSRWNGMRFTMVSTTSVATVFIAPVIMMVACLCIDASLVTMACLARPSFVLLPTFCCGVRNMSAAYKIQGTAIERYSCHIYLVFVPHDECAILPNWISQSWPLASATAHCPFQFSLLSTITPRNFTISFDGIRWLPSISA